MRLGGQGPPFGQQLPPGEGLSEAGTPVAAKGCLGGQGPHIGQLPRGRAPSCLRCPWPPRAHLGGSLSLNGWGWGSGSCRGAASAEGDSGQCGMRPVTAYMETGLSEAKQWVPEVPFLTQVVPQFSCRNLSKIGLLPSTRDEVLFNAASRETIPPS